MTLALLLLSHERDSCCSTLIVSLLSNRFLFGASDSDSDDGKRVVRSAKDRRFDELRATSDEIKVIFFDASECMSHCKDRSRARNKAQIYLPAGRN